MELTQRQREVLEFIQRKQREAGQTPTLREIALHFGFGSMNAAADHVRALKRKGVIEAAPRQARSLRVIAKNLRDGSARVRSAARRLIEIPVLGEIPAGYADARQQQSEGVISIDPDSLGLPPSARAFALQVRGDSMIGRHILEGDFVIVEQGVTPRVGDVVAALIDQESTLKTFVVEDGKPALKAENPRYPRLIPVNELSIQGVMIGLVRKTRRS